MLANGQPGFATRTARVLTAGAIITTLFAYGCRSADANAAERTEQDERRVMRYLAAPIYKPDSCFAECTERINADSTDLPALLGRAVACIKMGLMEDAKNDIGRIIRTSASEEDSSFYLGMLVDCADKKQLELFAKTIENEPQYGRIYVEIWGRCAGSAAAVDALTRFIGNCNERELMADAYFYRALAYKAQKDTVNMAVDYELATKYGTRKVDAYYNYGEYCDKHGDYRKMAEVYTRAMKALPGFHIALFERGQAHLKFGKYRAAISDFTKFMQIAEPEELSWNSYFEEALKGRAAAYKKSGKIELALQDYNELIEKRGAYYLRYERGECYHLQGRHVDAIRDYENSGGKNERYYDGSAIPDSGKRKYGNAVDDYTKEIARNPKAPEPVFKRGFVYQRQGDYAEAVTDFTKVLETEPRNQEALRLRAEAFEKLKQYDNAVDDYHRLAELDPENPKWHIKCVEPHVLQGNDSAAISDYSEAIERDWSNYSWYLRRGELHAKIGENREAVRDFTAVIELDRVSGEVGNGIHGCTTSAYLERGKAYEVMGEDEKALADYNSSLDSESSADRNDKMLFAFSEALDQRRLLHIKRGEFQAALDDANLAIHALAWAPTFYNRGYVYFKMGDLENADKDFNQAVKLDSKYAKQPYK